MTKLRHARPALDDAEKRLARKLATSRHASSVLDVAWQDDPGMITRSWKDAYERHRCRTGLPHPDGARAHPRGAAELRA